MPDLSAGQRVTSQNVSGLSLIDINDTERFGPHHVSTEIYFVNTNYVHIADGR